MLAAKVRLTRHAADFVVDHEIHSLLDTSDGNDPYQVREIIAKSMEKHALTVEETATLVTTDDPELVELMFSAARELKRLVYGNRIVLFAPLYIGNECVNDCEYCAFRRSNTTDVVRRTLTHDELVGQVSALEGCGHKRLILVFGEHPDYHPDFIAECVRTVYNVRTNPHGEIRRVNINAAPLDIDGFKTVKAAGIGTYQVFQETYHHATYRAMHPGNTLKSDYLWRLDSLSRAFEAGCDDMGIGALFGLYDWRFDVLGLVTHARHLQQRYGVGPHTISFPRLQPAAGVTIQSPYTVSDYDFKRLIAILRLAVPYTGMILTAREHPALRRDVMEFGVSQIDAGSRIEIGGYTEAGDMQRMEREQFRLGDVRPLDVVMRELMEDDYIPSFCTACYRLGRTGDHFMEYAIPGFIGNFCTPNALLTLLEYLIDYASPETRSAGLRLVAREYAKLEEGPRKALLAERIKRTIAAEDRDLYF